MLLTDKEIAEAERLFKQSDRLAEAINHFLDAQDSPCTCWEPPPMTATAPIGCESCDASTELHRAIKDWKDGAASRVLVPRLLADHKRMREALVRLEKASGWSGHCDYAQIEDMEEEDNARAQARALIGEVKDE
jgi:hypothetical protein